MSKSTNDKRYTPIQDTLDKIDENLAKAIQECQQLASKQREEVLKAYADRDVKDER